MLFFVIINKYYYFVDKKQEPINCLLIEKLGHNVSMWQLDLKVISYNFTLKYNILIQDLF